MASPAADNVLASEWEHVALGKQFNRRTANLPSGDATAPTMAVHVCRDGARSFHPSMTGWFGDRRGGVRHGKANWSVEFRSRIRGRPRADGSTADFARVRDSKPFIRRFPAFERHCLLSRLDTKA